MITLIGEWKVGLQDRGCILLCDPFAFLSVRDIEVIDALVMCSAVAGRS
jgi:hypothetical protein